MELVLYDKAKLAIAEAVAVDEVKDIRDKAEAMRVYAKQSQNVEMANQAAEIRIRAERRLGEMLREQKESGGMNTGSKGQLSGKDSSGGSTVKPPEKQPPTLAEMGISKAMSSRAQAIADLPEEEFEEVMVEHQEQSKELTSATFKKLTKKAEVNKVKEERGKEFIEVERTAVHNCGYNEFLGDIKDSSVDLLITDPPFSTDVDDISGFASDWLGMALPKLKKTGRAYICIGAYPKELKAYLDILLDTEWIVDNPLIWTYRNTLGVTPKRKYNLNYQVILHLYSDKTPDLDNRITKEMFSVQDINAPDGRQGDRFHKWQKPFTLAYRLIQHGSKTGDVVIDPFAGTGTFVIAAQSLGRVASGCDIDADAITARD